MAGKDPEQAANVSDRTLGMNTEIDRRDFIYGVGASIAGSMLAPAANALPPAYAEEAATAAAESAVASSAAKTNVAAAEQQPYPPLRTGMRGSHPGSFEVAHAMRDHREWDVTATIRPDDPYDLVVVGGGISGLASAHFFVKEMGRTVRVLILENHDDFGGHAKRNQFEYQGRMLALNGGTLDIESPNHYNEPAKHLLAGIGIDLERYRASNAENRELYRSLGLGSAYFFDKETWGKDSLVHSGRSGGYGGAMTAEFLAKTPLPEKAQQQVLRLYDPKQPDYMPGLTSEEKKEKLAKISYDDFLLNVAKVDKEALWLFHTRAYGLFCAGCDILPALYAWNMNYPGFSGMNLEPTPEGVLADLPGGSHGRQKQFANGASDVHFPDGNATITRLLVRWLIPEALPGTTMEDSGTAMVNYDMLDRPSQTARIRLRSTVINVHHNGGVANPKGVVVTYVQDGKTYQVSAAACVMACWNMFIPYLVPELPAKQKEALAYGVKAPLVYTNVAVKNWRSFQKLGISSVTAPGMYHYSVALSEATTLGDLKHAQTPDEAVVVHMIRAVCSRGLSKNDQFRAGRAELLRTPFSTFERNIRDQLARILGPGGFDPTEDILAITVNRWPHGYAFSYNTLYDPIEWALTSTETRPCVTARQPFGLITIANADSQASPHTDAAILAAYHAVTEVLDQRGMPIFKSPLAG